MSGYNDDRYSPDCSEYSFSESDYSHDYPPASNHSANSIAESDHTHNSFRSSISRASFSSDIGFFLGAKHVTINGGTFLLVGQDYRAEGAPSSRRKRDETDYTADLIRFSRQVALDAIYDVNERSTSETHHDQAHAHAHATRIIEDWILDPAPKNSVLWLPGAMAYGKSAIPRKIAELLFRFHPETYAASFFFDKNTTGREGGLKLFSTLAYQLALHFPSIRNRIIDALYSDPDLPSKSMATQYHSLIVTPLLQSNRPSHTPTVIIDGLDECEGPIVQDDILSLISRSILEYNIPLRFLFASRPEPWIRFWFESAPISTVARSIYLIPDDKKNEFDDHHRPPTSPDISCTMESRAWPIYGYGTISRERETVPSQSHSASRSPNHVRFAQPYATHYYGGVLQIR